MVTCNKTKNKPPILFDVHTLVGGGGGAGGA